MDASQSPGPSDEGDQQGQTGAHAPSERDTSNSFFKGLIRRASGALSSQNGEGEALSSDEFGPAFRRASAAERAMISNILRLQDLRVEDVMTPRADIIAVPEDVRFEELMETFQGAQHSRLPVYHDTLDDPIGFVHIKDLALSFGIGQSCDPAAFRLSDHLHTALFVPPSMRIAALLQKMQAGRVHMALVIDEFGGVDGLVTIEDLVEQIIGDIEDEHDTEELLQWRAEAPGIYIADARADIREFEEAEQVALLPEDWEEDVDTLGGLVFMLTGRVPARGEIITHPAGHEFEIIDADPRRIRRLRLSIDGARAASGDLAVRAAAE